MTWNSAVRIPTNDVKDTKPDLGSPRPGQVVDCDRFDVTFVAKATGNYYVEVFGMDGVRILTVGPLLLNDKDSVTESLAGLGLSSHSDYYIRVFAVIRGVETSTGIKVATKQCDDI